MTNSTDANAIPMARRYFRTMDHRELERQKAILTARLRTYQAQNLDIDMTRGKPCPEQLDLSLDMLHCVDDQHYQASNGTDCRNYGGLGGIPEARELFAQYLEVEPDEIIVDGNSSLPVMHDAVVRALIYGMAASEVSWGKLPAVRFLCPAPGYDRHFSLCQELGIEMIPVDMTAEGPDMDQVEELVARDEYIKGMWCVPKYGNPTGVTYSDDVVERLAQMETAAGDFTILWDNAYAVHHLVDNPKGLKPILKACKEAGHPDRVILFGSTSKVTFPGAGLGMLAGSRSNIERAKRHMSFQTIGPDKLNQLRHVRFFGDMGGIHRHMRQHAAILRPKFDAVLGILDKELAGTGLAEWNQPEGGYFVSINTLDGCARAVVGMAAEVGVKLTPAGAAFPYGHDPRDRNIRIAPSFPLITDIQTAMEVLALAIQVVGVGKLLGAV
jgi:aspartate/methionine/tyrosine aminotransferase